MAGKWVQAEDGDDKPLNVYVWVEVPDPTTGTATVVKEDSAPPSILGPDGKPLRARQSSRPIGFGHPIGEHQ